LFRKIYFFQEKFGNMFFRVRKKKEIQYLHEHMQYTKSNNRVTILMIKNLKSKITLNSKISETS